MRTVALALTLALVAAVAAGLLDADTAEALGQWCRKC